MHLQYARKQVSEHDNGNQGFYVVLHVGPIKGPVDAVRTAIVTETRSDH